MPTSILPPGIRLTAGIVGDGGNNEIATFTDTSNIQGEGNLTFDGSTLTVTGALTVADGTNYLNIASHDGTNGLALAGTVVTATAAQLNYVNTTAGVSAASKAIITDSNGDFEMQDGDKIFFGTGADTIMYHTGSGMKMDSDDLFIQSSVSSGPRFVLKNTNTDNTAPHFDYWKSTTDEADNDFVGINRWIFDNDAAEGTIAAQTYVMVTDVTNGTEDAHYVLQVMINGTVTTSFYTNVSNEITGDFVDTSDVALKENIEPIDTGIDTVKKLRPVTFDWKIDNRDSSGFIAQEVEEVIPNIVTGIDKTEDSYEHKSIKTLGLLSHVTKALQESIEKIETLEAQVKELQEA